MVDLEQRFIKQRPFCSKPIIRHLFIHNYTIAIHDFKYQLLLRIVPTAVTVNPL